MGDCIDGVQVRLEGNKWVEDLMISVYYVRVQNDEKENCLDKQHVDLQHD
jgi:hypothetical protein